MFANLKRQAYQRNPNLEAPAPTQSEPPAAPAPGPVSDPVSSPLSMSGMIVDLLHRYSSTPEKSRTGTSYIHVSSLIRFCGRAHAFAANDPLGPPYRHTGPVLRLLWAYGRAAEDEVVSWILAATKRANIMANWKCKCGNKSYEGPYSRQAPVCPRCRRRPYRHTQLGLLSHENKVVGSPDLVIYDKNANGYLVIECKSITKERHKSITVAHADHVFQAMMYRQLLKDAGYPVSDYINILYICRDWVKGTPFREYRVRYTERNMVQQVARAMSMAREASLAASNKGPLPDRICQSITEPRARSCPHVVTCFEGRST